MVFIFDFKFNFTQIDANGQIFVKPDFNGEKPPYRIETHNDLRGTVYGATCVVCCSFVQDITGLHWLCVRLWLISLIRARKALPHATCT